MTLLPFEQLTLTMTRSALNPPLFPVALSKKLYSLRTVSSQFCPPSVLTWRAVMGKLALRTCREKLFHHISLGHEGITWRDNSLIFRRANLVAHDDRILNVARDNVKLNVDDAALVCPRDAAEGVAEEVEPVVGAAGTAVDDLGKNV